MGSRDDIALLRTMPEHEEGMDAFQRGAPPWSCPYLWHAAGCPGQAAWQAYYLPRFNAWMLGYTSQGVGQSLLRSVGLHAGTAGRVTPWIAAPDLRFVPLRVEASRSEARRHG